MELRAGAARAEAQLHGLRPIIFISAQTGYNVNKLMQLIRDVDS